MKSNEWKNITFCLLIAGLASGCFEAQRDKEVSDNSSEAKVSASDLCKAFGMDKSSANQSYKGKVIEVFGNVQETWGEGERTMVVLSGGDLEVRCLVSSISEPDLADLKVGRPTLVKGKCRGLVRGDIALGGCVIQDPLRGLKAKAGSGDMTAEFDLAGSLSTATEGVRDIRRSFHLFCKSAEKGHEESKATVMKALMGAWSPETNAPVVWKWLREEAEGGNVEACYQLGLLYNMDEDFGIDPKASVPWFKKASDGGHQEAMFTMAMFNSGGELVPTNKTEAARLLSLVDPKRQPRAAESLGLMRLLGDGVPVDIPKGLSLLETAVANGRAKSATTLGRIYLDGVAVPKDLEKARTWFLKAAEMGDAYGQVKAGLLLAGKDAARFERSRNLIFAALSNDQQVAYSEIVSFMTNEVTSKLEADNPSLVPQDSMWFRKINGSLSGGKLVSLTEGVLSLMSDTNRIAVPLADIDVAGRTRYDPEFRSLLARSIVMENVYAMVSEFKPPKTKPSTNDWTEALRELVDDGNPDAMAWLGSDLLKDPKTKDEGLGWLKKSAEAGSAYGQYAMGLIYLRGIGQPVDKETAFRMFKLASDQGYLDSMFTAGQMLMTGVGCEKDLNGGLRLVRQAADERDIRAILFLGRYFYGDRLGSRDAAQAFAWFRWGAVLGSPEAQYWLGRMYYEGKGLPADYNRAIQWLMQSASQDYRPAITLLDSDAASQQKMAEAKVAYQQELARHSGRLEEIRKNPKYDLVLAGGRIPSGMADRDREAYARYRSSLNAGATRPEALMAAYNRSWKQYGNDSSNVRVIRGDASDWRWLEAVQASTMGFSPWSVGGGGGLYGFGDMTGMVGASINKYLP